jgi:hypothetical protein
MPEDAPHGVSATEDAGFSRRPRATMATYIHAHVLLVPSTMVLPEQSPEFIAFESSWLFASVHGCSPRVAVNEVLSIACVHIRGHVLQLMASALRYAQPSARACVLIFRKACLALV